MCALEGTCLCECEHLHELACVQVHLHVRVAWACVHARLPVLAQMRVHVRTCACVSASACMFANLLMWVPCVCVPAHIWVRMRASGHLRERKCQWVCVCLPAHKCVCYLHVRAWALTWACMQVCARACCLRMRGYTYVRVRLLMRAPTQACVRVSWYVCARLCISACLRVCTWVRAWACIPARGSTCAQTSVHVYTCLREQVGVCASEPVHACLCVCVCACVSTYANLRACVLLAWTRKSAHMCIHFCTCLRTCTSACRPACAFVRACMFVCVFAWVRTCFMVSWGENNGIILCERVRFWV